MAHRDHKGRSHRSTVNLAKDDSLTRISYLALLAMTGAPAFAQIPAPAALPAPSTPPTPPIVFQSGTGDGTAAPAYVKPLRPEIGCDQFAPSVAKIVQSYYPANGAAPQQRLNRKVFDAAAEKYRNQYCAYGQGKGPAQIIVVDFARRSSEPRLHRIDLRDGQGIDTPIRVAHGIGSDPDQDGYATIFSNVYNSYTSSLGAALGAERYVGINGISLRLDGLEASNSQMRVRDIVVHSYAPERRRYFNASLIAERGRPGSSEGCLVVEPERRDWVLDTLENGGFLYAGYSGELPKPVINAPANVTFTQGTGVNPPVVPPVSGTAAGTPGNPPTAPISPAPSAPVQ